MIIPVSEPLITAEDIGEVNKCLKSGWISSAGEYIDMLEEQWAAYCGMKHGIAVCNGTVALQLAVASLKLQRGDEIIMPSFTIISCATAAIYNGLVPVFVDCDSRTWCVNAEQIAARISARTRAIMVVHMYGHPADMDPILRLAEKHNLAVIEDAAEAHGAEYLSNRENGNQLWRRCGGMSTISTFSFYANKLITTGEGGMVLTNDADLAERCRSMRNLCFLPRRRFLHESLGFNFRLTNLQAALAVSQIKRLPEIIERKRSIAELYSGAFRECCSLQLPIEEPWARSVYWVYGIVLAESTGLDANYAMRYLRQAGVDTRPFFLGMHEQPILEQMGFVSDKRAFPVTSMLARQGLYIPNGLTLSNDQVTKVTEEVRNLTKQGKAF